jgi:hypothetical protein
LIVGRWMRNADMVAAVLPDVATTQEFCIASEIHSDWQSLQVFYCCHVYPTLKIYDIWFEALTATKFNKVPLGISVSPTIH